mmetsp:Transcript_2306/g.3485  ORF Transcript_2306/g.3485 Transcript_2306/m.3485 type:complete len:138 (+) Transcript_2306:1192-1605(+)
METATGLAFLDTIPLMIEIDAMDRIMAGFRPHESRMAPNTGLTQISMTAARLESDDRIEVAFCDPKRSIRIGVGDKAVVITESKAKKFDISKGVSDIIGFLVTVAFVEALSGESISDERPLSSSFAALFVLLSVSAF